MSRELFRRHRLKQGSINENIQEEAEEKKNNESCTGCVVRKLNYEPVNISNRLPKSTFELDS